MYNMFSMSELSSSQHNIEIKPESSLDLPKNSAKLKLEQPQMEPIKVESLAQRLRSGGIHYGITSLASAASGVTLELLCVPAGLAIAAINPLQGSTTEMAIGALAVSYAAWGVGLWANYNQTWKALEETGVGTSVWAKVGYDVSKVVTKGSFIEKYPRLSSLLQRSATFAGFVAMEAVKEAPYYGAAFGGKIAIESLTPELYTPNMEISFLAGANVAAAVFNGLQAGVVNGALRAYREKDRIISSARNLIGRNRTNLT